MNKKISKWLGITAMSIFVAMLLTIFVGYLFGFRAALVVGSSSEPKIHIQSLVVDYKCSYEDLKVGDYITFKSGSLLTTHIIVGIAGRGDFESYGQKFTKGDVIKFENRGVEFERTITSDCQIVTMATNYTNYEEYLQKSQDDPDFFVPKTEGSGIECVNYSQVVGRVEYALHKTGKFIFFVRNNFLQIVLYGIILYAGSLFLTFNKEYEQLF